MSASFLDANIFIRYLSNDDPAKADRVENLLEQAAGGTIRLLTTEMVIAYPNIVKQMAFPLEDQPRRFGKRCPFAPQSRSPGWFSFFSCG